MMLNELYLNELRAHAAKAAEDKHRLVAVDARALLHLLNEVEQHRLVGLLVEGKPLPAVVAA